MPNIVVKLPEGVFDQPAREALAKGIQAAAKAVEGFGDHPRQEFLTWVVIEEVKAGYLFAGGIDPLAHAIPVIVFIYTPAGVIDETRRAEAVRLVHEAVAAAKRGTEARQLATSVMIREVADGSWGANGRLWRLPDFARAAGYAHLRHLATA